VDLKIYEVWNLMKLLFYKIRQSLNRYVNFNGFATFKFVAQFINPIAFGQFYVSAEPF
jgi:hypothetical protein